MAWGNLWKHGEYLGTRTLLKISSEPKISCPFLVNKTNIQIELYETRIYERRICLCLALSRFQIKLLPNFFHTSVNCRARGPCPLLSVMKMCTCIIWGKLANQTLLVGVVELAEPAVCTVCGFCLPAYTSIPGWHLQFALLACCTSLQCSFVLALLAYTSLADTFAMLTQPFCPPAQLLQLHCSLSKYQLKLNWFIFALRFMLFCAVLLRGWRAFRAYCLLLLLPVVIIQLVIQLVDNRSMIQGWTGA